MRRDLIEDACYRPERFAGNGSITIEIPEMDLARQIDKLMPALHASHPHLPQVVELKFFLGLSDEECADVLGIQLPSFQRRWQDARWWLYQRAVSRKQ
jgi:DNA-directed RNA polymerase specialized sigma24 family protein